MAAPNTDQYKALIIAQIVDNEHGSLATVIDGVWLLYDGYAAAPGMQYLFALRKCIEIMQGAERQLVNTARDGDRRVDLHQRTVHLQQMYDNTDAQIKAVELGLARSGGGGAVGLLRKTTPLDSLSTVGADGGFARMLRGDAFLSGEWRP